jgi:trigger factor
VNVTVETNAQSDATFHISLPWDAIEKESDHVFHRLAERQSVPGFRKGHAPRSMIERIVGKDAIYEEAIENLAQDAVRKLAEEQHLTLLATPHIHVHDIQQGEDQDVSVTVPVLARGELADYHDIHLAREPIAVTEEDIDTIITRARTQMAEYRPVDRPAQMGDRVEVNLALTVNEKEVVKPKDQEFDLVPDRTGIFTGMDEQIVGMEDGQTKEFDATIPADYSNEELAGQTAHYHVTINKISMKHLPDVDDEFARQAGGYDTVEAMREGVRRELESSRVQSANRKLRDDLIDALIERLTLAVPPMLLEAETDDLLQDLSDSLARERLNLDQYLQLMGKTRAEYREEMKPEAERRIRQRRVLDLVVDREGITVDDEEIQGVLDAYARAGGPRRRVRQLQTSQRRSLANSIARDKALDWLMEHQTTSGDAQTPQSAREEPAPREAAPVAEAEAPAAQEPEA